MSNKHLFAAAAAAVAAIAAAGLAYAQFPIMDMVANKVIQKYQTSTCEQLWQERAQGQGKPKPEMEQRAMKLLREDPQMRQAFFDKVAGPIVNKMFECGMIP
jgi:regulator of protease activity HflC (stomatin/prohibitin superfamily)